MRKILSALSVLVVSIVFLVTLPQVFSSSAQSIVTPSFYPLTTCPTCATPSNPAVSGEVSPAVSQTPQTSAAPCANEDNAVASDTAKHGKHHKKHHGAISNGSSDILQQLMDLINKLLKLLGGGQIAMPSTGAEVNPSTAVQQPEEQQPEAKQPEEEQPAQQQPCAQNEQPSTAPEISTANPSSAPSTGANPSAGPSQAAGSGTDQNVQITFYGAYDNDPKGSTDISDPVIHQKAGGTGTYADPLTFASPTGSGEYPIGTKIYVPLVQKYFVREDTCAVSWTAPNGCGAVTHVDLYVGNPSDSQSVVACEDSLTPSGNGKITVNPPSNLPVDASPIWNQSSGTCMKAHQ